MSNFILDNENHKDLEDGLDFMVRHWCNDNKLSGELAWLVVQSVATAKLEMFKGNRK